jgi:hypothetical protein
MQGSEVTDFGVLLLSGVCALVCERVCERDVCGRYQVRV